MTTNTSIASEFTPFPRSGLSRKERKVTDAKKYRSDDGTFVWYDENGKFHRNDGGPAVVFPTGQVQYWKHGILHRDGGPAITMDDGTQVFFKMSEIHNEEGPAIIRADGDVEFWLDGKSYDKCDWELKIAKLNAIS